MKHWEKSEKLVEQLSGGRITPGSGNGKIRGDIRLPGWYIEVKSTVKDKISVQHSWLKTLERTSNEVDVLLVIIFGNLKGIVYTLDRKSRPFEDWSTRSVDQSGPYLHLHSSKGEWVPYDIYRLKDVVDGSV